MATKQEVTAEEELTVKTQARAPSAGVVLQVLSGALCPLVMLQFLMP